MNSTTIQENRVLEIRRIFEEQGFGNFALLEQWDGEDVEDLRTILTEEEMQVLLDQLQDQGDEAER